MEGEESWVFRRRGGFVKRATLLPRAKSAFLRRAPFRPAAPPSAPLKPMPKAPGGARVFLVPSERGLGSHGCRTWAPGDFETTSRAGRSNVGCSLVERVAETPLRCRALGPCVFEYAGPGLNAFLPTDSAARAFRPASALVRFAKRDSSRAKRRLLSTAAPRARPPAGRRAKQPRREHRRCASFRGAIYASRHCRSTARTKTTKRRGAASEEYRGSRQIR
jgi:hypothetical protein